MVALPDNESGSPGGDGLMSVWNLAEVIARRRRSDPDAIFRTPLRPGPHRQGEVDSRPELPRPEQIAGYRGGRTDTTPIAGRFSPRGPADSFPMP